MSCDHPDFVARVDVNRIHRVEAGAVKWFQADVRVTCAACHLPFRFLGLPGGLDLRGAAVSVDGEEARLAIAPRDEVPPPFGPGDCSGFTIRPMP